MPCPAPRAESLLNLVSCITCSVAYVALLLLLMLLLMQVVMLILMLMHLVMQFAYAVAYAVCLCSCLRCCDCLSRTRALLFSVFLTFFADYKKKENSARIKKIDAKKRDFYTSKNEQNKILSISVTRFGKI